MGYYETLDEMLKMSGLTLQEVADRCAADYGVKINRSYISKLKTARQAPASDEVNIAIAKVCGGDVEQFLYEAYLEKAPEFLKTLIKDTLKAAKRLSIEAIKNKIPSDKVPLVEAHFNQLSDVELMKQIGILSKNIQEFSIENLGRVSDFNEREENYSHIFDITMPDDSMEPTISEGAILHIDKDCNRTIGDIVVVLFEDKDYQIRRYYPNIDEYYEGKDYEIILTSDNPSKEPIVVNASEVKILGKVTSVTTITKL
jgi:phage repressor protein C with HTH and peptisase S24 domain